MGAILGWSFFGLVLSLTLGVAAAQFVCNPDDPRFERKDDPENHGAE